MHTSRKSYKMVEQRTRAEVIARLLANGVTLEEMAEIAAQEAADQVRAQVPAQQSPPPKPSPRAPSHPAHPTNTAPTLPRALATPLTPAAPPKARYRIRNWKSYNQALVQRGSLTIWLAEDTLESWRNADANGLRGRDYTYSDIAIVCALTLKAVYHLPLRATEGLLTSIVQLSHIELPIPDYTTLSRRQRTLRVDLPRGSHSEPIHVVVDSTGLKLYGEGEWKVRQHGYSKRRTWRKIHLGVDEAQQEIVACVLTERSEADSSVLPQLLEQVEEQLEQVSTDGAYDTEGCYHAITARGARAVIPPREDAVLNSGEEWAERNATIRRIAEIGRAAWKVEAGYHRRSLAETAVFRLKTIFGAQLSSRTKQRQKSEAAIRCAALNQMTRLGLPESVRVEAV